MLVHNMNMVIIQCHVIFESIMMLLHCHAISVRVILVHLSFPALICVSIYDHD